MKRRTWILGSAAALGGGLAVGLFWRQEGLHQQALALTNSAGGQLLGGWLRLAPDNTVTLYVPHSDMGQGVMTTLGMMVANAPAVFLGDKLAGKIPMKLVHGMAAAIFAVLGVATLAGAGRALGF